MLVVMGAKVGRTSGSGLTGHTLPCGETVSVGCFAFSEPERNVFCLEADDFLPLPPGVNFPRFDGEGVEVVALLLVCLGGG